MSLSNSRRPVDMRASRGQRSIVALAIGVLGYLAAARSIAAEPYPLPAANPVEIQILNEQNRPAADLVKRAEAALVAGHLERALQVYTEASRAAPRSGPLHRRRCELLTALGRKVQALEACKLALRDGGNVVDLRVNVAAMLSGPGMPTSDTVISSTAMADGAQRQLPGKPWGYAALADIARRIGDEKMMRTNLAALESLAPGHYETLRAKALAPPSWRWLKVAGWGAFLLVTLLALSRTAIRWFRRARLDAAPQIALLLLTLTVAAPTAVLAAEPPAPPPGPLISDRLSDLPIDESDPEKSIPTPEQANRDPLQFGYWLMDMASLAEEAEKKQDWRSAIRYYQALVKTVPDKSISYGKLCNAYERLGERDNGLRACRDALSKPGARGDDYSRYTRLLLDHPGAVTAAEQTEVADIIKHLRQDGTSPLNADEIQCFLGARMQDLEMLEGCVTALIAAAPDDPRTITYHWTLAMGKRQYDDAARLMERAKIAGVKPERISEMQAILKSAQARGRMPLFGGAIIGVAGLAFLVFRRASRRPA